MAISEEEKKKIEEEENYRAKVRKSLETKETGKNKKKENYGCFTLILSIIFVLFLVSSLSKGCEDRKAKSLVISNKNKEDSLMKELSANPDLIKTMQENFVKNDFQKVISLGSKYIKVNNEVSKLVQDSKNLIKQRKQEEEINKTLSRTRVLFEEGKYKIAWKLAEPYKGKNEELDRIAKDSYRMHTQDEVDKLLIEVKKVSSREIRKNLEIYKRLKELRPDSQLFNSKYSFYYEKNEKFKPKNFQNSKSEFAGGIVRTPGDPCESRGYVSSQLKTAYREIIKINLKTPTLAKFDDYKAVSMGEQGDSCIWNISALVTSQNSFGALITKRMPLILGCNSSKNFCSTIQEK